MRRPEDVLQGLCEQDGLLEMVDAWIRGARWYTKCDYEPMCVLLAKHRAVAAKGALCKSRECGPERGPQAPRPLGSAIIEHMRAGEIYPDHYCVEDALTFAEWVALGEIIKKQGCADGDTK